MARTQADRSLDGAGIRIAEAEPRLRLSLRVAPSDLPRLEDLWPSSLPTRQGEARVEAAYAALRLGPDEWLLTGPALASADRLAAFTVAAREIPLSVVEVSDRDMGLRIEGPRAAELLQSLTPFDVAALAPGHAIRGLLGRAGALFWRQSVDGFHLDLGRSFANYGWSLLETAITELG